MADDDTASDETGYAEALAELEAILEEIEDDGIDVDVLASRCDGRPTCCACAATASTRRASRSRRSWPTSPTPHRPTLPDPHMRVR